VSTKTNRAALQKTAALCCVVHAVTGFTNKSLRGLVAGLLDTDYITNQMTYDLRRLRLHGIIDRLSGTHTYRVTSDGIRVAVFYTEVDRLFPSSFDALFPRSTDQLETTSRTLGSDCSLKLVTMQ
jgi:predicted MarR family transcription regulator